MTRMEIITRTERRRKWTDAERERILAECNRSDTTIKQVAQRYDVAESLIYTWRAKQRTERAAVSEPVSFISFGEIAAVQDPAVNRLTRPPSPSTPRTSSAPLHDVLRPHPGDRPGSIDITLTTGERLIVDSFVNEKALARVLRVLRGAA